MKKKTPSPELIKKINLFSLAATDLLNEWSREVDEKRDDTWSNELLIDGYPSYLPDFNEVVDDLQEWFFRQWALNREEHSAREGQDEQQD